MSFVLNRKIYLYVHFRISAFVTSLMEHFKLFLLVASFLFPLALSIVLFVESRHNLSCKIMAFTLLNTSVIFLLNYFYVQKDYAVYLPLHSIHAAIEFLVFPAIYLYIKSIIEPVDRLKDELWHFLPGVIMLFVASYIFYVYTSRPDLEFFLKMNREGYVFHAFKFTVLIVSRYIDLALIALQGVLYSIAFFRTPKHYDDKLKNEFSNVENFSLDWINKYNLIFISVVAVGFLSYAVFPLKGFHLPVIVFVFFLFSAFVCTLGIVSLKQQKVDVDLEVIDSVNLSELKLSELKDDFLVNKLIEYMEVKQVFLQSDISLTTLSRDLGTNRSYLSALINQQFGMNFNAYINQYRVKYVKDYLADNPKATKADIFEQAGFGSLSTLKRAMGKTG